MKWFESVGSMEDSGTNFICIIAIVRNSWYGSSCLKYELFFILFGGSIDEKI